MRDTAVAIRDTLMVCWGSLRECIYCGTEAAVLTNPPALGPAPETGGVAAAAPVEYTAAVDRYLGQAALNVASRRVYRISLAGWAWPLVNKPILGGPERRGAAPPGVPLVWLGEPG